ncbi:hypothetical protein GCM10020367_34520 [Streptomyces sannanensis]|uniref:Uncharacterized protein n=1 Tax=Streptomyces sannanensis TaxID=285536 RepID=A0ABP6SE61_9ACTN
MNRDQDDDMQALRRMLPVPAERDFPAGRQPQREEHLMNSWLTMSRRTDKRRNLGVRIALPAGLAAAAAGIALTVLPSQTAAAYTLQTANDGTVELTVVNPSGKIDPAKLEKDLDKLGVNSRVYAGDPDCSAPPYSPPSAPTTSGTARPDPGSLWVSSVVRWDRSREFVLHVRTDKIPADKHLEIVFPLAKTAPAHAYEIIVASLVSGPGPDCVPAEPDLIHSGR